MNMSYDCEKILLPEFPRTLHLPLEPNAAKDDKVASIADMKAFLALPLVVIEEKVDGANSGMRLHEGMPLIRNRSHVLNKAYVSRKTPAQIQFSAVWTWFYENMHKFATLESLLGFTPSVYGEWLYAKHAVGYNQLPDTWVAYDIYDAEKKQFLCPLISRELLTQAGFAVVPLIASGSFTPEEILKLRDGNSVFSNEVLREGIYLKGSDGSTMQGRYKMVAPHFKSDDNWNKKPLEKNKVIKKKS
jgi:atypical dual specificity phosphatase